MQNSDINKNLLNYIDGELSKDEVHQFEQEMLNDAMLNDAVEGLNAMSNKKNIDVYVNDLNKHLQQYTLSKKVRRKKGNLILSFWIVTALILVMIFCCIIYMLLKTA